jgi:hypothetical protein
MQKVIVEYYQATDGKRFNDEKQASKYQKIVDKVEAFNKTIISRPTDMNFSNGQGYIQHPPGTYNKVENILVALSNEYLDRDGKSNQFTCMSYVLGRTLDDSDIYVLNELCTRLMCIDKKTNREYGQSYYALHPEKCKAGKLN